jgi:hypothetical protein
MNLRRNLIVALGAGALAASSGSFAQQWTNAEEPDSPFVRSTTTQNISYPEQDPAADVKFLRDLTTEANSMVGKNTDEAARIAKPLQEKLDSVEMNLLLIRLDSNPNSVFRFRALEQLRVIRKYTEMALAQAAKSRMQASGSRSSKAEAAPKR